MSDPTATPGSGVSPNPPETAARPKFLHNAVAHPLMFFWPRVGWWLHERTQP